MKIVLLTTKSQSTAILLEEFRHRHIHLNAIFLENRNLYHKVTSAVKRYGLWTTLKIACYRLLGTVIPVLLEDWLTDDYYRSYADKTHIVDDFNGTHCEHLLQKITPDLIVLGRSRILRKHIISIPKVGILNAHPGLLPEYRGIFPVQWAIYNGDDIWVTVHFIDEGVDTGPIIVQRRATIENNDTIQSLIQKTDNLAAVLMADTVQNILDNKDIRTMAQSAEDGKQYYKMSDKLQRETERKLAELTESLNKIT